MTIIELLNKIANGEEVPKKIKKMWEYEWRYDDVREKYCYMTIVGSRFDEDWLVENILNDTVEILEEENKIEKLNDKTRFYFKTSHSGNFRKADREELDKFIDKVYKQLDLLLDEINKLKEDKSG